MTAPHHRRHLDTPLAAAVRNLEDPMTLTERIRRVTTTCDKCGTTVTIGELPTHRRLETCHPSWSYRLPERFQDPGVSDLASRPLIEEEAS